MDLNNFGPLTSAVWGTVSDWMMVLVTSLTAVYLIKTFISQEKLKEIEIKRYIEGIKPTFQIEIIHPDIISNKSIFQVAITIVVKNVNGTAKNVIMDIAPNSQMPWAFWIEDPLKPIEFPVNSGHMLAFSFNGNLKREKPHAQCTFIFAFEDLIGNTYRQFIILSITDKVIKINPSIPLMV